MTRGLLLFLSMGIVSIDVHSSQLRHLLNSWPHFEAAKKNAGPSKSFIGERKFKRQKRALEMRLESWIDRLLDLSNETCPRFYSLALKDLLASLRVSGIDTYQALEDFEQKLLILEGDLAFCATGAHAQKWYFERDAGLDGKIGLSTHSSNYPRDINETLISSSLKGVLKGAQYWSALDVDVGLTHIKNDWEWPYSFNQENVILSGDKAFRTQFFWEKSFDEAPPHWNVSRYDALMWGAGLGFGLPIWERFQSFHIKFSKNNLGDDFWFRQSFNFLYELVLHDAGVDTLSFFMELESVKVSKNLSGFNSSFGIKYSESFSEYETASIKLGVQDRRQPNEGAALWPVFALEATGRDLAWENFYPYWFLGLSPLETPWATNTLRGEFKFFLKYNNGAVYWPVGVGLERDFYRSAPGGKRDDLNIQLITGPAYKLSESLNLESEFSVGQRWVLFSDQNPIRPDILYVGANARSYKGMIRLNYVF